MKPIEFRCTVTSFRMLTPTVFELNFQPDQGLTFAPGQFVSIIIPGAGPKGRDLRRAYSIASAPHINPVELCVKLVEGGPGTNYLYRLRPGDTFRAFAPYGNFIYHSNNGKDACFIATGTGIAPFRSMVTSEFYKNNMPRKALCLLGVRHEEELLYLDSLVGFPGLEFVPTITQPKEGWKGFRGRVTDYLKSDQAQVDWLNTDYYLCGNGDMIQEMKALLTEKGVQKDSIHQEKYY